MTDQDFDTYYYEPIESEYTNDGNKYANSDNEAILEVLFYID